MIHQDESVSTHLSHSGSPVCFLPQSYTISGHWMTYGWLNYSQEKYYRYDSVRWNYKPVGEIKKSSHHLWNNHLIAVLKKYSVYQIFFSKSFLWIISSLFCIYLGLNRDCRHMDSVGRWTLMWVWHQKKVSSTKNMHCAEWGWWKPGWFASP